MYFYYLNFMLMDKIKTLETLNNLNKNTLMQTLEIEFVDVGNDYVTAKMPVNFRVHQPYGILHGGATAALAETVGSCASTLFRAPTFFPKEALRPVESFFNSFSRATTFLFAEDMPWSKFLESTFNENIASPNFSLIRYAYLLTVQCLCGFS